MQSWYVVHTKPSKERQVHAALIERGMEVYLPVVAASRADGRITHQPFFARYLFVRADLDLIGRWSLQYLPGSRGLVMIGEEPAVVPDQKINYIREQLERMDAISVRGDLIAPGDPVVFVSGPFADWRAIFDRRLDSAGRARVLIHLLERWTHVDVEMRALSKAGGMPRPDLVSPKVLGKRNLTSRVPNYSAKR